MRTKVKIGQVTLGKVDLGKIKVYDIVTGKVWANEVFETYEEAEEFCKDNKLTIVEKQEVKLKFEETIQGVMVDSEDNNEVKLTDVSTSTDKNRKDADGGLFIRLISNCPDESHYDINSLIGRKIRITIETID